MLRPQNSATREAVPLDGLWRFALEHENDPAPWLAPLRGDLEAAVPASYNDLFTDQVVRDHVGWVWYQRDVRVPRGWADERVILRFDAATHEALVYVDDVAVSHHVGGYLPFETDVTESVRVGETFRLTVGVSNVLTSTTMPPGHVETVADGRRIQRYNHDFFNYAGLARSVWLCSRPAVHIADITVQTDREDRTGIVRFDVVAPGASTARAVLTDANGREVATAEGLDGSLRVEDAVLWRPGEAYLYDLTVEAMCGDAVVDSYALKVGIRTVSVRGSELLINETPFHFTGFGKHEDTAVRGKGFDASFLVHDFELMKWTGANSFRTAHYPYAEEVLDYADRQGFVVIDEAAAVGLNLGIVGGITGASAPPTFGPHGLGDATREAHAQHLRDLVARDKNHPSVVMWSIANEPASQEPGSRGYFEPLVQLVRELDATRPVTFANVMTVSAEQDRIADLFDVLCINRYYGWYVNTGDLVSAETALEADLRAWADRFPGPIVMAEYGADTMAGVRSIWDQPWTEDYQVAVLEMFHRVHDRIPSIVGEHVWNFADFQTSPGIFRVDGNKKGVFTRDRRPKQAAYALRERWTGRTQ